MTSQSEHVVRSCFRLRERVLAAGWSVRSSVYCVAAIALMVMTIARSPAIAAMPGVSHRAVPDAATQGADIPQHIQFRIEIGPGGGGRIGLGGRSFGGRSVGGRGVGHRDGMAPRRQLRKVRPRVESETRNTERPRRRVIIDARRPPKHPDGRPPRKPRRPVIVIRPPVRLPPPVIVTEEPERWRPGRRITKKPVRVRPPVVALPPVIIPPLHVAEPPPPPSRRPVASALPQDDIWPNELVAFIDIATQPAGTDLAIAQTHNLERVSFEDIAISGQRLVHYRITDGRSVSAVVQALGADARVALVSPNYRYVATGGASAVATKASAEADATPRQRAEPASVGLAAGSGPVQFALAKMRVPEARALASGRNVTVAVIDSGIDGTHPALAGAISARADLAEGRGELIDGHGTAIAGIIRAKGQVEGVAPEARLAAARAFFRDAGGTKTVSSTYIITRAIYWSLAQDARILNMSFAGPKDLAVAKAVGDALGRGAVLVAAAGNSGAAAPPAYPAAYPGVIAVTAIDTADALYKDANRGTYVSLAAPGVNVLVVAPKENYRFDQGTSIAAAHVSGVIALLLERKPTLNTDDVRRVLSENAVDLGEPGRDQSFGAGRIDALATIGSIKSSVAATERP